MRPCLAIPIFDHGGTIAGVVESLAPLGLPCLVVDDGSGAETRAELARLADRHPWLEILRHPRNRGRGAALCTAYRAAAERGHTHVIQLDADGQHDPADVPRFLDAARARPDALVLGTPIFDESAPWVRRQGRKLSQGIVWLETLSFAVRDPLCGFRCVPLAPTLPILEGAHLGARMDFDPELIVRLVRAGVPVVDVPTRVRYFDDGISHFRMVEDNLRLAWAYLRLAGEALTQPFSGRAATAGWESRAERGSRLALRFLVWCFRRFGRSGAGLLLHPVAAYFFLFAGSARRASHDYLVRLARHRDGSAARPPSWAASYHHIHRFAEVILDRFSFWAGLQDEFAVTVHGRDVVQRYMDRGLGVFLIGAHLGSFDVLRVIAREAGVRVNVVMFTANAERINAVFRELDPRGDIRLIDVDPGSLKTAFAIRRCIRRGELVAMLGDRVAPGGRDRITHATFLGEPAAFSTGPFLLPVLFRVPVFLSLALKTGPRAYEIVLEQLADDAPVSPDAREKEVQERIETYAARLEHYCLRCPDQWFNFYDYWQDPESPER